MVDSAEIIWADGPSSAPSNPPKAKIRAWGKYVETALQGAAAGATIYDSKADMDADTSQAANAMAWVLGDATAANNGVYQFDGTSTWTQLGDLPYSYIAASNAGAGTANAIVATTSIPVPAADGASLIALPIVADNTSAIVTVSFNGGTALTLVDVAGASPRIGDLRTGMILAGYRSGTSFRYLNTFPTQFVRAVNSGTGTADAIAATTPYPLPSGGGDALIALPIAADTTSSPVTVSFNGGDPLTIKTASGNDVVAGGLKAGMIVAGYFSGSSFRLLSDQASAAIQSAAEVAQEAAETAAAGISVRTFASVDDAEVATIASTIDNLLVAGRNYVRVTEDYQLLGLEQIENGGFDTDSGWTKGAGWTIADGVATRTNTGSSSNTSQAATIDVEAGTAYFVAFDITAIASGSVSFFLGGNGAGANRSSIGSYSEVIVATTTVTATFIMSGSSTFAGSIDNVSVKALPTDALQSADGAWWGPVGASIERVDDETVYKVADLTALSAVDTTKHNTVYLGGSIWAQVAYADVSSIVTADTIGGYAVQSTRDATKAWIRQTDKLTPTMFGAAQNTSDDSYGAISCGLAVADAAGKLFYFDRGHAIGTTLEISATTMVSAAKASSLRPSSGSGLTDGVVLAAGNVSGKISIPTLVGFAGTGLDIRCALARIYIDQFHSSGTAIKFNADSGSVLDSIVTFNSIAQCDLAVEFSDTPGGHVTQGCGAYGNFITSTTNAVKFTGAGTGTANDGLFLDVLAIDFTEGGGALLDNAQATGNINRFRLYVRSWLGGLGWAAASPTQFAKGGWLNLNAEIILTVDIDQSNFSSGSPAVSTIKTQQQTLQQNAYALVSGAGQLSSFNGGKMLCRTEFPAKFTLTSDLAAGAAIACYFFHVFADANSYQWQAQLSGTVPAGLVVERVYDQSATTPGCVLLGIRNISGAAITSGSVIRLLVSRVK